MSDRAGPYRTSIPTRQRRVPALKDFHDVPKPPWSFGSAVPPHRAFEIRGFRCGRLEGTGSFGLGERD